MGDLLDFAGERAHQICRFIRADNLRIMSHTKGNLQLMPLDLIEDAEKWDLAPKPASLWWKSTREPEV